MEEPAEIAVLTSEYISSALLLTALDNLPLEISHILREVELKDAKVKVASRETQMREMYRSSDPATTDGTSKMSEANRSKFDKLAARISADYERADEWAKQKVELTHKLWLHYNQLLENIDKINPELVASVAATLPKTPKVPGASELCAALNDAGVGDCLEADDARSSAFMLTERKRTGTINGRTTVRTHGQSAGGGSEDARDAQGAPLLTDVDEERDETLYCFCNRPSFGEMIGCDSDECKYEWFHIACVGVSKPLPQTWVCSDCLKNKKRRRT